MADGATWLAQLQRLAGRKVLNAGASGYGFDQSVLRAEKIAATRRPSAIVVSFIADDIRRTEMRRMWGAEKPYFDFQGAGLCATACREATRAAQSAPPFPVHSERGACQMVDSAIAPTPPGVANASPA